MKWRASFVLSSSIALTRSIAGCHIRNEEDKRTGAGKNAENGQAESKRLSRQVIGPARRFGWPGAGGRGLQLRARCGSYAGSGRHGRECVHERVDDVDVDK